MFEPVWYVLSLLCEYTRKNGIKTFEIYFVIDLLTTSQAPGDGAK